MELMLVEHELFDACRILFGTDLNITRDFLEYLQASGLKSAYRKKALETHPDRIAAMGASKHNHDSNLFIQVQEAYEDLTAYLDARQNGLIIKPTPDPATRWQYQNNKNHRNGDPPKSGYRQTKAKNNIESADWNIDSLFNGPLPEREMRLGHFLYYSGLITWRQIFQALVWQRSNRPRLGELGQRFGWLDHSDILNVLHSRTASNPFGKTAVELGLLTEQQLQTLVWRQKGLQRKIGEYFIENNILSAEDIIRLIRQHQQHNAKCALSTCRLSAQRY